MGHGAGSVATSVASQPRLLHGFQVDVGGAQYKTPMIGDGYQTRTFPSNGVWSRADIISHPRYAGRCLIILGQILENRLFSTIRTKLGLCYSIAFQASRTDDYDMAWGMVAANAFADKRRINIMVLEIVKVRACC